MSANISSVITGSFIELFNKSSKSSNSALASALTGKGGDSVDYRTTLQSGASVYSKAIQTISSVGGYVNLAVETLTELGEITDKLINLAEDATKATGSSSFRKINRSFQKLVKDFNKLVDNANYNDHDYLALEDLEELFKNVGLDPEKARDLKKIFDDFIIAEKDTDQLLASGATKPTSYSKIPSSAFSRTITKPNEFEINQITESKTNITNQNGLISNVNSVTEGVSEGSSYSDTLTFTSLDGSSETTLNFETETSLKTVNTRSGYSVIESSDDLISGKNQNGIKQLFVLDERGNAIQQVTNFTTDMTFGDVSLSDNGKNILYAYNNGTSSIITNSKYDEIGDSVTDQDLKTITSTDIADIKSLSINSDGSYCAFLNKSSSDSEQWEMNLINSETLASDDFLANQNNIKSFGFTSTDSLAILSENTDTQTISTYSKNSNQLTEIATVTNTENFTVLEKTSFENSYISYTTPLSEDTTTISVITDNGDLVFNEQTTSNEISSISMRNNEVGSASIGIFETNQESLTQEKELFEYGEVNKSKVIKYSSSVSRPLNLLSDSFKLTNRASGYVALDNLKAIKEQINTNLDNLNTSLDYMQKNIDLARATGLALLDVSYEVQTYDDAESLAKKVRQEILKTSPHLLGQVHNLEHIATAAVLYELDNQKGK